MYLWSPKRRGKREDTEKLFEDISENFPVLTKEMSPQIQETKQTTNRKNLKKFMPRHIVIKLLKTRQKKKSRKLPERNDTLPIGKYQFECQLTSYLKPWWEEKSNFFSVQKEKNYQSQIWYLVKLPISNEWEIRTFSDNIEI